MGQSAKNTVSLTSLNIIEIWCGAIMSTPKQPPLDQKLNQVNHVCTLSNMSTARASIWQMITGVYSGNIALTMNGIAT